MSTLPYAYMTLVDLGDVFLVRTGIGFCVNICQPSMCFFVPHSITTQMESGFSKWLAMARNWDWKTKPCFQLDPSCPVKPILAAQQCYHFHMTICFRWNLGLVDTCWRRCSAGLAVTWNSTVPFDWSIDTSDSVSSGYTRW